MSQTPSDTPRNRQGPSGTATGPPGAPQGGGPKKVTCFLISVLLNTPWANVDGCIYSFYVEEFQTIGIPIIPSIIYLKWNDTIGINLH